MKRYRAILEGFIFIIMQTLMKSIKYVNNQGMWVAAFGEPSWINIFKL